MARFLRYSTDLFVRPRVALRALLGEPRRVALGFLGVFVLAAVYFIGISVALALDVAHLPQLLVLDIPAEQYYSYGRLFILPVGLAGTIVSAGVIRLAALERLRSVESQPRTGSWVMMTRVSFGDSSIARFLFRLIALVMESPLRRRFFDPVKTLNAAGIQSGQQVLEVGCGTGFFTIAAAELVGQEGRVYAIDPHPSAIEQVAKKIQEAGLTNVGLIRADATEAGLASGSIDLALLFGVIPSPTLPLERLLPELSRLLTSEGTLAVWTAVPWWSPASLSGGGLFIHVGGTSGVHSYRKATSD